MYLHFHTHIHTKTVVDTAPGGTSPSDFQVFFGKPGVDYQFADFSSDWAGIATADITKIGFNAFPVIVLGDQTGNCMPPGSVGATCRATLAEPLCTR